MSGLRSTPMTLLAVAAACLSVAGCREAGAQTPIPPAMPDFAVSAMQSDEYEIMAAKDALAQSQKAGVKSFAEEMVEDHTAAIDSLRKAASASGLQPPPEAMSSDQAAMLSSLQSLRGGEFDQTYARQQVLAHQQALAVVESYAKSGTDANFQKLAQSLARTIKDHLDKAEKLRSALGGA